MPTFEVEPESIPVFKLDDEYVFSYYFEREDIFEDLKEYYNGEEYRFEIPESDLKNVEERLSDRHFELQLITDPDPFVVVTEKYDKHAEILKKSVVNWERQGHRFFLMKDERAVKEAVERGATPIDESDFVSGI